MHGDAWCACRSQQRAALPALMGYLGASEVSIRQSVWSSPRSVPVCMPLGMRDWPRPRPYLGVSCLRPRNGESVTLWVAKHVRGQGRGELTDLPKRR